MPSLTRTPNHKFLLDENVQSELCRFLKQKGYDAKLTPKGISDEQLATISKTEERVLVTNDEDFYESTEDEVFSVVWLRISQNDRRALVESFEQLLKGIEDFSKKLIVLYAGRWDEFPLFQEVKL